MTAANASSANANGTGAGENAAALPIRLVEKPWGKDTLPPPFTTPAGQRIGEIWFEPPIMLGELLVKYIFTSEALSVQVHPTDAQTEAQGLGHQGKTECWLVVAADPGARIGVGFRQAIDADAMRAAALDGLIEPLLGWYDVGPGDFFLIPANTVHAIGAGVSLIEIQQNSDITYRLYDYGRPRELHLDRGVAVADGRPYPPGLHRRLPPGSTAQLVEGEHFRLDRLAGLPGPALVERYRGKPVLVIPLTGVVGTRAGAVHPGECGCAASIDELEFDSGGLVLLAQPIGPR